MRSKLKQLMHDERGAVMDVVLVVGIISLPLVMFLAIFGQDVIRWIRDVAPRIFDEGGSFLG